MLTVVFGDQERIGDIRNSELAEAVEFDDGQRMSMQAI